MCQVLDTGTQQGLVEEPGNEEQTEHWMPLGKPEPSGRRAVEGAGWVGGGSRWSSPSEVSTMEA